MTRPLYWLDPIRNFPSEIEDTVRQVAAVRRQFLTTGALLPQAVRSIIGESWQRSANALAPDRTLVPLAISEAGLADLRAAHEPFLRAARPVVSRLTDFLAGSGYIIGLADPRGRLLMVDGDQIPRGWLEQIGLAPGGDWSEAMAGTNGIGTALAVDHAVQVLGPEHFCDGFQDITCITVPIRHPCDRTTVGVLDLSGDYHLVRPYFTGILAAAALEIRQNLHALLSTPPRRAEPFQIAVIGLAVLDHPEGPRATRAAAASRPGPRLADDLQARLDRQERRAFAAERLALAIGAVSASLDIQATLERVAEQAAHLLGLAAAAACVFDDTSATPALRAWAPASALARQTLQAAQEILAQTETIALLRGGEPITIDDAYFGLPAAAHALARHGVAALALLPLLGAHGVIGFIFAPRPGPCQWQADDLRLGLTFALHATSAVENARLFEMLEQHRRHIEGLNAVNQLLHTLVDPAQHLDMMIERIVSIMEFDTGLILLRRRPDDDLTLAAQTAVSVAILPDLCEQCRIFLRELADGRAAAGESRLICGLQAEQSATIERLRSAGLCDVMIAPLAAGGEVLGALLVGNHQHCKLTGENLTLFTSIGQQLGLALKNAQLLRTASETEALREADRIKSQFLTTVSHDLRSPLTAIRTSVESLLDQGGERSAEAQEQLLDNIAGQAKRLGRMVDQLLDLSRIEAGALKLDRDWTELGALIADTSLKFERLYGPRTISQNLMTDLPLVYVDPDRLVQVFWNLLENAAKYTPATAPIIIDAAWIGSEVLIRVADRGSGIPPEDREKVFQYFYRLERDRRLHMPGSGLGLAICRGIVGAHGGRIWVEPRPGGGSRFCIALPLLSAFPDNLQAPDNQGPAEPPNDLVLDRARTATDENH